jgi:hypothetical protein
MFTSLQNICIAHMKHGASCSWARETWRNVTTNDRLDFQSKTTAYSLRAINNFRCPFRPKSHYCTEVKANSKHSFPLSAVAIVNHSYSYHHSRYSVPCYVQCGRDTNYRYTDGQNITKYNYYYRNNEIIIKIRRHGKTCVKIINVMNIKTNLWQQTWENLQQKWTHINRRILS